MLVTAGPTYEPIDAVRYIANRSSGRMGIAIAEAARNAGWDVTLLLGPVCHAPPAKVNVERFVSTEDLQRLLDDHFPSCDLLVMAAAVADYRPVHHSAQKLARETGKVTLQLESTPDLVAACANERKPHQRIIGFALEEPAQLDERAANKLRDKKLDAIVANSLDTMNSDRISGKIFTAKGDVHAPPHTGSMGKQDFANWFVEWIDKHLQAK